MSTLENCLISKYLLCFSTRVHIKKLLRYAVYTFYMIYVVMFKDIFKDINMPEGMNI